MSHWDDKTGNEAIRTTRLERLAERDRRDIERRTFAFAVAILRLARQFPADLPGHAADQVVRLGTNIGAQVAEAQASSSRRRHLHCMNEARRDSAELPYWLRLLTAGEFMTEEAVHPFLDEVQRIHGVLVEICLLARQNLEAEPDSD